MSFKHEDRQRGGLARAAQLRDPQRDAGILALKAQGLTLTEIAKRVGLTRQRVGVIVRREGRAA